MVIQRQKIYTTIGALQQPSQETLQVLFKEMHCSKEKRNQQQVFFYLKNIIQVLKDCPASSSDSKKTTLQNDISQLVTLLTPLIHCPENLFAATLELKTRNLFVQDPDQQQLIDYIARSSLNCTRQGTIQVVMQIASQQAKPFPKAPPQQVKHSTNRYSHQHHISGKNHRDHISR